jgi:hypothetical protein
MTPWLAMSPEQAQAMARALIECAADAAEGREG